MFVVVLLYLGTFITCNTPEINHIMSLPKTLFTCCNSNSAAKQPTRRCYIMLIGVNKRYYVQRSAIERTKL